MAQQIINTGAVANDGTGDPLRTAFTETNNNFTEIYTAGPVDSNVRITDNTILTINTNGNLVLAPNGTGVVQSNVNIVPNQANVRNLGSSTRRWSTLYLQYADISNTMTVGGGLTVGGNLTVSGNIIQVGNIITDSLTIQLGNTAANAAAANGAGITVGANDNIATVLYNSTSNVWTTNIGLSAVGNISAPYFIGNGSLLTGLAAYGNANVATFLAAYGSNTIVTTGNVTAGNVLTSAQVIANGVIQTGTGFSTGGYLSVNGASDLHDTTVTGNLSADTVTTLELTVNTIRSDDSTVVKIQDGVVVDGDTLVNGNITADYFIGNAAALIGLNSAGEHAANLGVSGWTELNSNVVVQVTGNANSYAQINFQNISNGTHATTDYIATAQSGNDSTYFVDMGIASGNYDATDANNSLGNSLYPQDSYLYAMGGNSVGGFGGNLVVGSNEPGGVVRVIANGSTVDDIVATFSNAGMAVKGNIIPAANAVYSLGNSTNYWANLWVANNTIYIGGVALGMTAGNVLTVNGNAVLTNGSNTAVSTTGNITAGNIGITGGSLTWANASIVQTSASDVSITGDGQVTVRSLDGTYQWTFDSNGNLAAPGNVSAVGNVTGAYVKGNGSALTNLPAPTVTQDITSTGDMSIMTYDGVIKYVNYATVEPATGNIKTAGNISATGNVVANNIGNIAALNLNGNANTVLYGNGVFAAAAASSSYGNANVATFLAAFGSNTISTTGNITAGNFIGNGAGLTNVTVSAAGNIVGTSSNVSLVAGSYTMTFDNTGLLTLPTMGGNEGGELNLGIPVTNTTLQNRVAIDVFQDRVRIFEGSANAKGVYIDLAQSSAGVGTLLNNRVSGLVNAGTFVTMDNIKATVTTSANRGLSLATVSGSFTYDIGGTYATAIPTSSGSAGTGTLTTTPTTSIFNWGFTNQGDMSTYILTDTTNSRAYRITLQIGNAFNNNMISIERLI